jgi:hypothetical protein
MEKTTITAIVSTPSNPVTCTLCLQIIPLEKLCEHLEMHNRAEMLADILALSRR